MNDLQPNRPPPILRHLPPRPPTAHPPNPLIPHPLPPQNHFHHTLFHTPGNPPARATNPLPPPSPSSKTTYRPKPHPDSTAAPFQLPLNCLICNNIQKRRKPPPPDVSVPAPSHSAHPTPTVSPVGNRMPTTTSPGAVADLHAYRQTHARRRTVARTPGPPTEFKTEIAAGNHSNRYRTFASLER